MKKLCSIIILIIQIYCVKANESPVIEKISDIGIYPGSRVTVIVNYKDNDKTDIHTLTVFTNSPDIIVENISGSIAGSSFDIVSKKPFISTAEVVVNVTDNSGTSNAESKITFKVNSSTSVSGSISNNTVWMSSKVKISGDLTVEKNATLTIQPGVVVEFSGYYSIIVKGNLVAKGTKQDSISFTAEKSAQEIGWAGIKILENTSDIKCSQLSYCKFEYGGGAISVFKNKLIKISYSLFTNNLAKTNDGMGGAIYSSNSYIVLEQNRFTGNRAYYGGAFCADTSRGVISNNFFYNNTGNNEGGAIDLRYASSFVIEGNSFIDNTSKSGGAIDIKSNYYGLIRNNVFTKNKSNSGGALSCKLSANINIVNNLIYSNIANTYSYRDDGGGIQAENSRINLINNTIYNNIPNGLGVYESDFEIINCIITRNHNVSLNYSEQVRAFSGRININNCLVEKKLKNFVDNDYTELHANNIFDTVPDFVDATNNDFSLAPGSVCVNSGRVDTVGLNLPKLDIAGNARFYNSKIDLGAIEYNGTVKNRKPRITGNANIISKLNDTIIARATFVDQDKADKHKISILSDTSIVQVVNLTGDTSGGNYKIIPKLNKSGLVKVTIKVSDNSNAPNATDSSTYSIQFTNSAFIQSDTIKNNTIWNTDTIKINREVLIEKNALLTISPGTVVEFEGNYGLSVRGMLIAKGNIHDSIIFTWNKNSKIFWKGISIFREYDSNLFSDNDSSIISYCKVEHGIVGIGSSNYFNLLVEHSLIQYNSTHGIYINQGSIIRNNKICYNKGSDGAGIYINGSGSKVINNFIFNNKSSNNGGGIYLNSQNSVLSGNIIARNSADYGGGLYLYSYGYNVFINNTFANNYATTGGGFCGYLDNGQITNSIFWGNIAGTGKQLYFNYSTKLEVVNSVIQGGENGLNFSSYTLPVYISTKNLIELYPSFADTSNLDFSLKSSSSCINTGISSDTLLQYTGTSDINNNKRVYNNCMDIGAIEFQGEPENRLPILNVIKGINIKPNTTGSFKIHYTEPDKTDNNRIEVTSLNSNLNVLSVSGDSSGSIAQIEPIADWKGVASVLVTVYDKNNITNSINTDTVNIIVGNKIDICGDIYEDQEWNVDTVFVNCNLNIHDGSTVTIKPGVTVIVNGLFYINVAGSIKANGTSVKPITFTCKDTAVKWSGIRFFNQANDTSEFDYCNITYTTEYSITANNALGYCRINHCNFERNFGAVYLNNSGSIQNSTFKYSRSSSITCNSNVTIKGNEFFFNSWNAIYCINGTNILIENNIIQYNRKGIDISSSDAEIVNNIISNNYGSGIYTYFSNVNITNNLISNNNGGNDMAGAIYINASYNGNKFVNLTNNTIVYNTSDYYGGIYLAYYSKAIIKNCIIYYNSSKYTNSQIFRDSYLDIDIINSDIENYSDQSFREKMNVRERFYSFGNISVAPNFNTDATYGLSDSSICINYIRDTTGLHLTQKDILGNIRYNYATTGYLDMGASEFQGTVQNRNPLIAHNNDIYTKENIPIKVVSRIISSNLKDSIIAKIKTSDTSVVVSNITISNDSLLYTLLPKTNWKGSSNVFVEIYNKKYPQYIARDTFNLLANNVRIVCGTITSNTVWDADTIKVNCNIDVARGACLTISKGTYVQFSGNYYIHCYGSIRAKGTKDKPIVFNKIDSVSKWNGIYIYGYNSNDSLEFDYCTIQNVDFQDYNNFGALTIEGCKNFTISNCKFLYNRTSNTGGALMVYSSNGRINNSIFSHNMANIGGAIALKDSKVEFFNNLLSSNMAERGGALYLTTCNGSNFVNNTFVNNDAGNAYGAIYFNKNYYTTSISNHFINNIIYSNYAPVLKSFDQTLEAVGNIFEYCDIEDLSPFSTSTRNCFDKDPKLGTYGNYDYALTNLSPCINKGIYKIDTTKFPFDLMGNKRIFNNGKIDIGAYEFQDNPPLYSNRTISINEGITAGTIVDTIKTTDIDGDSVYYFLKANVWFSIDSITGIVKYKNAKPTDYELLSNYNLTLYLKGAKAEQAAATVDYAIKVINTNDNAPVFTDVQISISENQVKDAVIHTLKATDADSIDTLKYFLIKEPADSVIIFKNNKLILNKPESIDYEKGKRVFNFKFGVTDNVYYDTANIEIKVLNINDSKCTFDGKFASGFDTISVFEDPQKDSLVYSFSYSDPDSLPGLTIKVLNNSDSAFTVRGSDIYTYKTQLFDYETVKKRTLNLILNDGKFSDTAKLVINIKNKNETPVIKPPYIFTISENPINGAVVGVINASDIDGDSLRFGFTDELTKKVFSINNKLKRILVADSSFIDYEQVQSFYEKIYVTDKRDTVYKDIVININNINDNPPTLEKSSATIFINDSIKAMETVFTIQAKDLDSSSIYYSVTDDKYKLFYVLENNVLIKDPTKIAEIENNKYDVEISVSDNMLVSKLILHIVRVVKPIDTGISVSFINGKLNYFVNSEKSLKLIEIVNSQGQVLFNYKISNSNQGSINFYEKGLKSGCYIVRFIGNDFEENKTILIQNY